MSQQIQFKSEVDSTAASQLAEHLVSQEHPSLGIKIDLSPLRRSLAAPPSPGRLTPEEAARRDKETAQQLKEEHQAKVKAEKREKQNAKKEKEKAEKAQYAASPAGQAEAWLKGVVKDINSLNTAKVRLEATDLLPGIKTEWVKQLDHHNAELVAIRARMEAVRTLAEQPTPNLFTDGKQKVIAFKENLKDLNSLLNIRDRTKAQRKC